MGMRKVFVVGTGPLGCYPAVRLPQSSDTTPCRDEVNSLSAQYNAAVVDRLRRAAAGSSELRYSFFDQYAVLQRYLQEPEANGKKGRRKLMMDQPMIHTQIPHMPSTSTTYELNDIRRYYSLLIATNYY